jgi:hypothetical protein
MRSIDSLLDGIRAAYARIAEVETAPTQHPGDRFVLTSLESLKAHAGQLEQEWSEECRIKHIEVCWYKLISRRAVGVYSASAFAKSLLEFQELFAQIVDAKTHGTRVRARVSGEILAETTFELAYTYPGSLGVVLTLQDTPDLLSGKFDETIQAFSEITNIEDEHDVRDVAKTLGDAVVKKVYDWSSVNYLEGYNIDVTWTRPVNGVKTGQIVDREALGR